jgi:hypothetical protein
VGELVNWALAKHTGVAKPYDKWILFQKSRFAGESDGASRILDRIVNTHILQPSHECKFQPPHIQINILPKRVISNSMSQRYFDRYMEPPFISS